MVIFSRYTWWVGAMVGLALLLTLFGAVGILSPFQGVFLRVASPFENALSAVFDPVASFLSDVGNVNDLRNENARLRLQNEELQNKVASLQEESQQVAELQQALGVQQSGGAAKKVAANVVAHDTSPGVDVISIDKGSGSGIRVGMTVLSSGGTLMGTVTKVTGANAFVRLVTDTRSKVNARTLETQASGVIEGTLNRGLSFGLAQQDVNVGDTVVTSGLGGNYPPDVPIGKVTAVSGTPQDLFRSVTVEPTVRLSTVRTVLVNTTFVPQSINLEGS
ncbi:MAG TPA: rod shape-determining protein MreC [Tepidiformaceae bacterium]|nr:rod shape-determining protein MreC [Tepidiformaceae bacterium]